MTDETMNDNKPIKMLDALTSNGRRKILPVDWTMTRIKTATMDKIQEQLEKQPREISQQEFIDQLLLEALGVSETDAAS